MSKYEKKGIAVFEFYFNNLFTIGFILIYPI